TAKERVELHRDLEIVGRGMLRARLARSTYAVSSTDVTNGRPATTSRTPLSSIRSKLPSDVPAIIPFPSGAAHMCMTPPFKVSVIFSQVAPLSPLRKIAADAPSSRIHKFGLPLAQPT